jgi:hypothetical protein
MKPEQRIRELCAQLMRVENLEVFDSLVAELKSEIENYARAGSEYDLEGNPSY